MAEFGAHLTSAIGQSRPSVFDAVAQDSLMSMLRPALGHACKVLAESNPAHFGWIFRFSDELYTAFDLVLEHHYLKKYRGSFSENFYGLKRVCHNLEQKQLPSHVLRRSLLFLVIVPYLKLKLDSLFEKLRLEVADGLHMSQTLADKCRRLFVTIYPYVHLSWGSSMFVYLFLYTFNKTCHYSPFIHLSGATLDTLTEEDVDQFRSEDSLLDVSTMSFPKRVKYLLMRTVSHTVSWLSTGLSLTAFFLQFLDWWYNSEQTRVSPASLPIPNPPKSDVSAYAPNLCLLCNRIRTNDTALAVSGHVFCYPCIYNYVKANHRCPLSGYPCEPQHLIKLYLQAS